MPKTKPRSRKKVVPVLGGAPLPRALQAAQAVAAPRPLVGNVERHTIAMQPALSREIAKRGPNRSKAIHNAVGRFYRSLAQARAEIRLQFAPLECGLLCDVYQDLDANLSPEKLPMLAAYIRDALAQGRGAVWDIDEVAGRNLVAKLEALSYHQLAALVDAIERWLTHPFKGGLLTDDA